MKPTLASGGQVSRNPFGVQDAPDPDGDDVVTFSAEVSLCGADDDPNAQPWATASTDADRNSIDGQWSSRWNGGVDATIAGDSQEAWKRGVATMRTVGDRVYILFDWDNGARRALVDARRDGSNKLTGRYINLSNPEITRAWTGLIVSNGRVDGRWTNGRLDFRR